VAKFPPLPAPADGPVPRLIAPVVPPPRWRLVVFYQILSANAPTHSRPRSLYFADT